MNNFWDTVHPDMEVDAAISAELKRQQSHIELIASENIVSLTCCVRQVVL